MLASGVTLKRWGESGVTLYIQDIPNDAVTLSLLNDGWQLYAG